MSRQGFESREWMASVACSVYELKLFSMQMGVMFESGVDILSCLEAQARQCPRPQLTEVFWTVYKTVASGHTLSQAMSLFPRVFSREYVGMIRVAEQTGKLALIFELLGDMLERREHLQQRCMATLTYPFFLVLVSLAAFVLFAYFVIPAVVPLVLSVGAEIPLPTRVLMAIAGMLHNPFMVLVPPVALLLTYRERWRIKAWWESQEELAEQVEGALLRLPAVGPLLERICLTRALDVLSVMVKGGASFTSALRAAAEVSGNRAISAGFLRVRKALEDGEEFGPSLLEHAPIRREAVSVLSVGEQVGRIVPMAEVLSRLYTEQVELELERVSSLLEPVLMLMLGGVATFMVLSTALPTIRVLQQL